MKIQRQKSTIEEILRNKENYENYRNLIAQALSQSISQKDLKRLNSYFRDINHKADFSQWNERDAHNYQYTQNKIRDMYPQTLCKYGALKLQKAY
ncbi:MAG: hypothetical protein WC781_01045 [Candidatus Pacearchaeota archaeon]|jgi:hypothetical protein